MIELLLPMLRDSMRKASHSAMPDAPVIPDPPPGPTRRRTARLLRATADRLDRHASLQLTATLP
ncbi:hypothetical protein [Actinoplanes sp. G11-F43]|uniref:hypothetical protein n=1 Tax=Actinoplanes sp. G11-F43 TaxID=3424130 RepID=UPI003D3523E1